MKKVLLVVIDALSSEVVRPAIEQGRLPTLQRFIEAGQVCWNCTSVFPSITPAATSSISTGYYPVEHGIMGAYFYDREVDSVRFFGSDIWVIWNRRFRNYVETFVDSLNRQCLSAPTIFQRLEERGRTCACLNFMIFRGGCSHKVHTPWLFRLWPGMPRVMEVAGPETLCLGDFVAERRSSGASFSFRGSGGIFNRYGFCDKSTGQFLQQLAHRGMPDFTLAYFPDNDFDSHSHGPEKALETVQRVDRSLAEVAETWGGVDGMLDYLTVVVTGDHSQSEVDANQGIDLSEHLREYRLVDAGTPWEDDEAMMVCPNLRVAQIYLREDYKRRRPEIIDRLLQEPRVDQVLDRDFRDDGRHHFFVHTADRGRLEFWPAGSGDSRAVDFYGGMWSYRGELSAIDARLEGSSLQYGDYPNALERIANSFDKRYSGDLWVTAHLGHEFRIPRMKLNSGGSHGSLHRLDSTAPLIVSDPQRSLLSDEVRIVDVAPLCLSLLGEAPPMASGQSHAQNLAAVAGSPVTT